MNDTSNVKVHLKISSGNVNFASLSHSFYVQEQPWEVKISSFRGGLFFYHHFKLQAHLSLHC